MADIVENKWKWLEMAGNCYKLLTMATNFLTWLELMQMALNGWKWLYMAGNGKDNHDDDYNESNGMAQSQF